MHWTDTGDRVRLTEVDPGDEPHTSETTADGVVLHTEAATQFSFNGVDGDDLSTFDDKAVVEIETRLVSVPNRMEGPVDLSKVVPELLLVTGPRDSTVGPVGQALGWSSRSSPTAR